MPLTALFTIFLAILQSISIPEGELKANPEMLVVFGVRAMLVVFRMWVMWVMFRIIRPRS
jgi:hypothetical protein